jgi:hypothetical protein
MGHFGVRVSPVDLSEGGSKDIVNLHLHATFLRPKTTFPNANVATTRSTLLVRALPTNFLTAFGVDKFEYPARNGSDF